jgi:hypothetical protein
MRKTQILFLLTLCTVLLISACQRPAANVDGVVKEAADRERALRGGGAFECHEIRAFIPVSAGAPHSVEGEKCVDNRAVVNGWSISCVPEGQCDSAKRLAELNQAAEGFCAEWCSKKKCDYSYSKHDKCDSSDCYESAECKKNCDAPFQDSCFFIQSKPNYNCKCTDRIQG